MGLLKNGHSSVYPAVGSRASMTRHKNLMIKCKKKKIEKVSRRGESNTVEHCHPATERLELVRRKLVAQRNIAQQCASERRMK